MLNYLLYYLLIVPVSRLPFPLLYLFSDFLFLVVYRLIGYRRKVVLSNIQNSFPEKSDVEHRRIEREFYRHFCDLVLETLKGFTISEKELHKHIEHMGYEILEPFFEKGRSVLMVGGHYGNWELLAISIDQKIKHQTVGLYTPLSNKFFDKKMKESRSRFGLHMVPIQVVRELVKETDTQPKAYIFGADQSPRDPQKAYWMEFLNQDTGVQFGTEKFAKEHNLPVVFGNIYKRGRGKYEVTYTLLVEEPSKTAYGEITEAHTKILEEVIRAKPEYWLWSHKRWKHKRPEGTLRQDLERQKEQP